MNSISVNKDLRGVKNFFNEGNDNMKRNFWKLHGTKKRFIKSQLSIEGHLECLNTHVEDKETHLKSYKHDYEIMNCQAKLKNSKKNIDRIEQEMSAMHFNKDPLEKAAKSKGGKKKNHDLHYQLNPQC